MTDPQRLEEIERRMQGSLHFPISWQEQDIHWLIETVRTQAAEIERLRAVEIDLDHIIGVLGPAAPKHGCEGCAYEMGVALKYARSARARLCQEKT